MSDRRGDGGRERVSARQRAEEHKSGFDRTTYRVPEGRNVFNIEKEGVYRFDVVAYTVPKGAKNPYREDGQIGFERTFFIHRGIGADDNSYVCPKKTVGTPCPICEERQRLVKVTDAGDKEGLEMIKALAPKERQLWNILDHDNEERGVQLWEASYHLFGKQLDARVKAGDEDDGYEYFADPQDGSTLKVAFGEKSMGGNTKFYEANSIDFKRRSEPLSEKVLASALPLDTLLIIEPYDKLKAIFLQIPADEVDDDAPKKDARSGGGTKPKDEPKQESKPKTEAVTKPETKSEPSKSKTPPPAEGIKPEQTAAHYGFKKDDKVVHREHGPCSIFKVSGDGTSLMLIDAEDEVHKGCDPKDCRLAKSQQKEAPKKEEPKPQPKQETKADDTDDWGDGANEDAAPAAAAAAGGDDDDWDKGWADK